MMASAPSMPAPQAPPPPPNPPTYGAQANKSKGNPTNSGFAGTILGNQAGTGAQTSQKTLLGQ